MDLFNVVRLLFKNKKCYRFSKAVANNRSEILLGLTAPENIQYEDLFTTLKRISKNHRIVLGECLAARMFYVLMKPAKGNEQWL